MKRHISLVLVLGLFGAVAVGRSRPGVARANPLRELANARVGRAFAPRLSIPTEYRPCTPLTAQGDGTVSRETCGEDEDAALDVDAFASDAESTDPDSLQASALVEVIWGDGTEPILDEAISRLLRALRLTRRPVPLLVDLSGAHLVRAERTQNPRDLVQGLHYAREALETEPGNQAALFNAALALEALAIDGEAAKAWDRYLAIDPASRWANEARQRKRALQQPQPVLRKPSPGAPDSVVEAFAARRPQDARLLGWDHELGEWGAAVLGRDSAGAAAHLDLAERLGSALERRGGDLSLADAVRAIRAAASDPAATQTLARAHRAYTAAQELFRVKDYAAAKDSLTRVIESRAPSSVLSGWAAAFGGGVVVYLDPNRADSILSTLLSRVDSVRHPAMAARVRWMWGTRLLRDGRYPEARSQYGPSARTFERLRETEFHGAVLAQEGDAADRQGDTVAAYRTLHLALLTLRHYRSSVWLHNPLLTLANRATIDGMRRAATPIQNEDVAVALRNDVPAIPLEALLGRVRVQTMAGESAAARRDMDAAVQLFRKLERGSGRDWLLAVLQYTRAMVAPLMDSSSTPGLDSAISFFKVKSAALVPPLLMLRADARLARNDVTGATADLDTVTVRIRRLSRRDANASVRAAMIEEARNRFDQLVMLHLRAGRTSEALHVLERGRVSFVPSAEVGALARRPELAAPPGQVALEYALIGDTLLIWTVRDQDVNVQGLILDRREFLHAVERVGAALASPARAAATQPDLERLYNWLVRPVEDRLGGSETPLVILADGEVAGVPFAALHDVRRRRYLIEDHSLRFAASLADAGRTVPAHSGPNRALLVADPTFDPAQYPTLDPLRGARAEVNSLKPIYPDDLLLAGPAATRARFTAQAQRAGVIHYAGHAVFDDARPERSFLVLAGNDTTGRLTAEATSSLKLRGVRLVVLSACRTLRTREGRSGGFAGLSGALLAAGAGGVVGSVWNVDDGSPQPLMLAFHREYLRTHNPAEALRQAQLQQLRLRRSPAAWAGFRYAGG
ncbi:MAG: CHAT domain-containing protein [Longimicrobiaceae bacterium]